MTTSSRLLRLLSLLQTPRDWTGSELADRLEVSPRTIRNDIERLRDLGYPVHATRGSVGGYRLEAGTSMPPLLLDDDEAVAVAIGLRTATQGAVTGIEETSLRALAKLEQVLPPRLRRQVSTLQGVTVQVRRGRPGPDRGSRDADRDRPPGARPLHAPVRLLRPAAGGVPAAGGAVPDRERRPALVPRRVGPRPGGLADVPGRPDARRACRRARGSRPATSPTPTPRPSSPAASRVEARQHQARVVVHAPAAQLVERFGPWLGTVTPIDETSCVIHTGADTVEQLAAWLGMLGADFRVTEPPELVAAVRALSTRYAAAAS